MYAATMRIFKHYHFNVKDPATAANSLSFSSYAGSLIVLQTCTPCVLLLSRLFLLNVGRVYSEARQKYVV